MRQLAHIEKIQWKKPIPNADRIELVGVLGWQCIAKKDEFNVGDKCIYIEIDSIVDKDNPNFAFLEAKHYKIKTMKMRGVVSQGIVFPMSILNKTDYRIGDDVTDELKITKIQDEVPKVDSNAEMARFKQIHNHLYNNKFFMRLMKMNWFKKLVFKVLLPAHTNKSFPAWIIKTDETRIQNIPQVLQQYKDVKMIVTEKIDGTSSTFAVEKDDNGKYDFAICSRNNRQDDMVKNKYIDGNLYHDIAKKYDIYHALIDIMAKFNADRIALQGEIIGRAAGNIQGNKYKIDGLDFYGFNLIIDGNKIDSVKSASIMNCYSIKWVPILDTDFKLLESVDEMLDYANGQSQLYDTLREGVVIRDYDNTISFKCVSNDFLLKYNL